MTCVLICSMMDMKKMIRPQLPNKLYKEIIDNVPGAEFSDKVENLYANFKELNASPHEEASIVGDGRISKLKLKERKK